MGNPDRASLRSSLANRTVLIIDDNDGVRTAFDVLLSLYGARVVGAATLFLSPRGRSRVHSPVFGVDSSADVGAVCTMVSGDRNLNAERKSVGELV